MHRGRSMHRRAAGQAGQALVEAAIVLPLLLLAALGLVQFALLAHAQHTVTGAAQEGARVAAAEDGTVAAGIAHADAVLRAGLGRRADAVRVQGHRDGDAVVIEVRGRLPLIIPWITGRAVTVGARSTITKEEFRAGPER